MYNKIGDTMIEELETSLNNIYTILKSQNINETELKKDVYTILRASLKNKKYELSIGEYYFNLTPKDIIIRKDTDDTLIEINNDEIYYETERNTESRFYILTDQNQNEYNIDTPAIQIEGHVMNIINNKRVEYIFKLINSPENYNIRNYIINNKIELIDKKTAILTIDIDNDTPMIDYEDYLDKTKIKKVFLDYQKNKYIIKDIKEPNNYIIYLPDISKQIVTLKKIYNYVIDFYNEYASKEIFQ
jgi:hypothetical protein